MNPVKANTIAFLKSGNRKAFEFLYLRYEEEFKRYAFILTGGHYADDLLQLTCLQIMQYDGRHKDPKKFDFKNFFCRSLHNTMINLYRTKKPTAIDIDLVPLADSGPYVEDNYGPLLHYVEKLLTPAQKKVIYMRMDGVKFKHIAREMGISMNTAVGIFRYSRMKLAPYKTQILLDSQQVFVEGIEIISGAI